MFVCKQISGRHIGGKVGRVRHVPSYICFLYNIILLTTLFLLCSLVSLSSCFSGADREIILSGAATPSLGGRVVHSTHSTDSMKHWTNDCG